MYDCTTGMLPQLQKPSFLCYQGSCHFSSVLLAGWQLSALACSDGIACSTAEALSSLHSPYPQDVCAFLLAPILSGSPWQL